MRIIKGLLVFAFITAVILLGHKHLVLLTVLASVNLVILSFNLIVRKSIAYKSYFLSPYNIFSEKYSKEYKVDIPADLAFDKILEVIAESGFKLITKDKEQMQILAISSLGFTSWGENIYFNFSETNEGTLIQFNSAALFQMYTWGKNEKNYSLFFKKLEDSFTI